MYSIWMQNLAFKQFLMQRFMFVKYLFSKSLSVGIHGRFCWNGQRKPPVIESFFVFPFHPFCNSLSILFSFQAPLRPNRLVSKITVISLFTHSTYHITVLTDIAGTTLQECKPMQLSNGVSYHFYLLS